MPNLHPHKYHADVAFDLINRAKTLLKRGLYQRSAFTLRYTADMIEQLEDRPSPQSPDDVALNLIEDAKARIKSGLYQRASSTLNEAVALLAALEDRPTVNFETSRLHSIKDPDQ